MIRGDTQIQEEELDCKPTDEPPKVPESMDGFDEEVIEDTFQMLEILYEEDDNLNEEQREKVGDVYELAREFDKNINWVHR
jgi:hypothetical protein